MSDNIQQPQEAEERRRQEAEGFAMLTYEQREAYYFANPPDTHSPYAQDSWERNYTGRDMTPDGRDIEYWNRAIIRPQFTVIHEINARARERK